MKISILKLFSTLVMVLLFSTFYASTGILDFSTAVPVVLVAGVAIGLVKRVSKVSFFEGLAPEVWIPLVKEDPYPDNSFISAAMDMSDLVNYDAINFAEAGADPTVLKNNTSYPVASADAGDTPKALELDYYDTTSTIVRNAVAIELAYDQRALYANKHKKALAKKIGLDAAYAYAPVENDASKQNTVISLGANDSFIDAMIDLQAAFNGFDDDGDGRNLVLTPAHMAKIAKEDKALFRAVMAEKGAMLYGFKLWSYSRNPIYVASTGIKAAQGAAFLPGTHKLASFAFLGSEVMRAMGTVEMFSKLKDPDIKGDKFNFQERALVGSLRGRWAGAILQ